MIRPILFCLLLLSSCLDARSFKQERESLEHSFVEAPFRIFYTLKGKHAITDLTDLNHNKIPDYVEDTMQHLQLADFIFKHIIGLNDPLKTKRYSGVEYIDIHLLNIKNPKHLGQAVDAIFTFKRPNGIKTTQSLSIDLRPNLEGRTFTPIHELFHIYQNGYNMMKNPWLVEGLARVAQRAFGYYRLTNAGSPGLPKTKEQRDRLYTKSYDAFFFWNELMYRVYGKSEIGYKSKILAAKYLDGRYILNDFSMHGFQFLHQFMSELEQLEREIEKIRGTKAYQWSVSEQLSSQNNAYIWLAIKNTIVKYHAHSIKTNPHIKALFLIQ
mgnify:CR=1 FL=1